jgi:hypothetical protein
MEQGNVWNCHLVQELFNVCSKYGCAEARSDARSIFAVISCFALEGEIETAVTLLQYYNNVFSEWNVSIVEKTSYAGANNQASQF